MKKFIKNHSQKIKLAMLLIGFCMPFLAFAANDPASETLKGFTQIMSFVVNIFTFIALVFLNYIGMLMDPDLLIGTNAMDSIRPMWVIMRNLTNIGFVLVLLFLSVSNLYSSVSKDGNWTIKEKLPKVIISLVAINFSLLGFRVAIDAIHIGTTALLSLSSSVLEAKDIKNEQDLMQEVYFDRKTGEVCPEPTEDCMNYQMVFNEMFCNKIDKRVDAANESSCLVVIDFEGYKPAVNNEAANLFLAFGTQFTQLHQLPRLAETANGQKWGAVISNTLFSSIMALMYIVAIVALGCVLLVRVVVLWMAMVFSPFLVAITIMGFGSGTGEIGKKIITTLLVPIKVAAVFGVSFIMISTMIDPAGGYDMGTSQWIFLGGTLTNFGGVYSLLWQIATLVVFWVTIFESMKGTWADQAVDYIQTGAQKMGEYTAKATVLDKPLIPMLSGGKPMSLHTLTELPGMAGKAIDQAHYDRVAEVRKDLFGRDDKVDAGRKTNKDLDSVPDKISGIVAAQEMVKQPLLSFLEDGNLKKLADKIDDGAFRNGEEGRKKFIKDLTDAVQNKNMSAVEKSFTNAFNNFDINILKNADFDKAGKVDNSPKSNKVFLNINKEGDLIIKSGDNGLVAIDSKIKKEDRVEAWKSRRQGSEAEIAKLDRLNLREIAKFVGIDYDDDDKKEELLKKLGLPEEK